MLLIKIPKHHFKQYYQEVSYKLIKPTKIYKQN